MSLKESARKVHPDVVALEYWVAGKEDHLVFLLDKNGEHLSEEPYIELQDGSLEVLSEYRFIIHIFF